MSAAAGSEAKLMPKHHTTVTSVRDVVFRISVHLLVILLPLGARAEPGSTPNAPLIVTRPGTDEAAARRDANRAEILDARLQTLHTGLKLSATQDALWPPVANAIRGLDEARGRRFRRQLESVDNSIDGLKMQGDHMAKVGAAMSRLADATKPLVASLSPDQKSRLPALLERVRPRKLLARAFELPMNGDASLGERRKGAGVDKLRPAGGQTSAPTTGKSGAATSQTSTEDDDD